MPVPSKPSLSHIDADGRAAMVDVSTKEPTQRSASAEARVRVSPQLADAVRTNTLKKGHLLETARLAGIMAAKRTDALIPLCHPLPLESIEVDASLEGDHVHLRSRVTTHARTGVEMEALTAVAVAALTVIDMGKAIDKTMIVEGLRIIEKRGGRSGDYVAPEAPGKRP